MKVYISIDRKRITTGDALELVRTPANMVRIFEIISQHVIDEATGDAVPPEQAIKALLALPLDDGMAVMRDFAEQLTLMFTGKK